MGGSDCGRARRRGRCRSGRQRCWERRRKSKKDSATGRRTNDCSLATTWSFHSDEPKANEVELIPSLPPSRAPVFHLHSFPNVSPPPHQNHGGLVRNPSSQSHRGGPSVRSTLVSQRNPQCETPPPLLPLFALACGNPFNSYHSPTGTNCLMLGHFIFFLFNSRVLRLFSSRHNSTMRDGWVVAFNTATARDVCS